MKDPQWYVFEPSVATMLPCKTNVREQKIVIEFNRNSTNQNCCASVYFYKKQIPFLPLAQYNPGISTKCNKYSSFIFNTMVSSILIY